MENKDEALQVPAEANRNKNVNYLDKEEDTGTGTTNEENVESRRHRHDADGGNADSFNEMLQKEKRIDPGNEHHHSANEDDSKRSSKYDADAGVDGTGTAGPEPGDGENDEPGTTGEDA